MPDGFGPSEPWRRSTRTRLTASAAVVIAAVLCIASVGAIIALQRTLLASVDSTARDDAADVAVVHQAPSRAIEPPQPDAAVQVVDRHGRVVAASTNAPREPLLGVRESTPASITETGPLPLPKPADAYHVAALTTKDERLTIRVAIPSDDVSNAVHQLGVVLAVGAPVLFVVLVLAWVVIGLALAPMNALLRRQQEFVSDAAHELRTPLAGVLVRLELVGSDPAMDPRVELPKVRAEVAHMVSLVEALLSLVRASTQRPPETTSTSLTLPASR